MGITRNILGDRDQAGHAAAALILRSHGVARALRRDHQDVEIRAGIEQVEVHVEAMREHQRGALFHVVVQMLAVDIALQFIGGEHHDKVRPFGGIGDFHHFEAGGLGFFGGSRALAQRDGDILDAGILQVQRMGVALAAIADDDDLFALDQVQVGVAIVINTHGRSSWLARRSARIVLCFEVGALRPDRLAISGAGLVHFRYKGKPVSAWRKPASCVREHGIERGQQQCGHHDVERPHQPRGGQKRLQRDAGQRPSERRQGTQNEH